MTAVLRAIPTRYKGILFRSKLEADWAISMDTLGIEWEYEPEGRYWGETFYAPDFWLPGPQQWFEVKGEYAKQDFVKWHALVKNWEPERPLDRTEFLYERLGDALFSEVFGSSGDMWVPRLVVGLPKGQMEPMPPTRAPELGWTVHLIPGAGFICHQDGRPEPPALVQADRVRWVVTPFPYRGPWKPGSAVETW